ncbi:MAG: GTPase Era [Terriglobales bacterium]|jgi:GTP-binding protein Era
MSFHSGFVCILGRPNAGKSTLLNALVGEKLAIISPKPQTTRNRILGIINYPKQTSAKLKLSKQKGHENGQIVLIDTPGVHRSGSSLGRKMMVEVREALEGCELILFIVDAKRKWDRDDDLVLDMIKKSGTPVFLLLNKIDMLADKRNLLPLITQFQPLHKFQEIIPISALKKKGLDELLECVVKALPNGPRYFPEDQITDQPVRFMAAELIREHVLMQTHEEVPHAVSVMVEQFEEGPRLVRIAAAIFCEREGQKAILLGKGGQMLKKIGTAARMDIEKMVGTKVFLELFVKIQPGWRDSRKFVEELDWRRQMEQIGGLPEPES